MTKKVKEDIENALKKGLREYYDLQPIHVSYIINHYQASINPVPDSKIFWECPILEIPCDKEALISNKSTKLKDFVISVVRSTLKHYGHNIN
jgi:hypothetical protein